jgi:hypothetical protein
MTLKQNYILLIFLIIISGIIVFSQYHSNKSKHERLLKIGEKANIIAKPYTSLGVNYSNYFFVTKQGKRIEKK